MFLKKMKPLSLHSLLVTSHVALEEILVLHELKKERKKAKKKKKHKYFMFSHITQRRALIHRQPAKEVC